jgi:hypothetical protein
MEGGKAGGDASAPLVVRLVTIALLLTCCLAEGEAPRGVDLAKMDGWDIVLDEGAIPSEAYAAEEVQRHLAQATGQTLPIVRATDRPGRHVFVGPGKAMRESNVGSSTDGFGEEDLRIVIREGTLPSRGAGPAGRCTACTRSQRITSECVF